MLDTTVSLILCPVGAGPVAEDHELHLRSFRAAEGLEARMEFSEKFNCFPNVVNGGAISTALDCHGNWCAAVTLMDEACLPWPPLTVTYNINLTYREPTPPNTPLLLVAKVSYLVLYEPYAFSRAALASCSCHTHELSPGRPYRCGDHVHRAITANVIQFIFTKETVMCLTVCRQVRCRGHLIFKQS